MTTEAKDKTTIGDLTGQIVKLETDLTERDRIIAEQATDRGDLIVEIESMGKANKIALEKIKTLEQQLADSRKNKRSSQYFGVSLVKVTGKWKAQVQKGGRNRYLGMFVIEEEAAIAVQECRGNKNEADRIRGILANRKKTSGEVVPPGVVKTGTVLIKSPVKAVAIPSVTAEEKKQKADAADGLVKIKGECTWQWVCVGCGEAMPRTIEQCSKCNSMSFEKIQVLKDPQIFLGFPKGRHYV